MSGRPPVAKKRQVPEIRMNRMNDREELSMLKKWKENKLVSEWNAFWRQEEGVGVIEVVLILVGIFTPLIHAIYYVDTVEIVEIEKQYKQECV